MSESVSITISQTNPTVGDLEGNMRQIINASQGHSNIIVTPELSLTGYPPEDLLLLPHFIKKINEAIKHLICELPEEKIVLVGSPTQEGNHLFNSVLAIHKKTIIARYHKRYLPNDGVFDEQRYFIAGHAPLFLNVHNLKISLLICEDIWHALPWQESHEANADVIIVANASPYHIDKQEKRLHALKEYQEQYPLPVIYTNMVGGQDELIFDGYSFVLNAKGAVTELLPAFVSENRIIEWPQVLTHALAAHEIVQTSTEKIIYQAIKLSLADYVAKNKFESVILGVSGGIDSALVLTIAVDALGCDRVHAAIMPSRYNSEISQHDASILIKQLGVSHTTIPIDTILQAFTEALNPAFAAANKNKTDIAEENLQARIRGTLLMALSNKLGYLVLTTSNKSESAVGYSTLYGDMAGGFNPLKDISKTLVYKLARWRNQQALEQTNSVIIPERILTRAPSAELRENQTDQDTLPSYAVLDHIISSWVEQHEAASQINLPPSVVNTSISLIQKSEYKRKQAPIGPRITHRGFGKDWRMPITSGYRDTHES